MKEFTSNIQFYIDRYDVDRTLYLLGEKILNRGWMSKEEFLAICLWKSRRPKKLYDKNTDEEIRSNTKLCFSEVDESKKIEILTQLKGVGIPTASALLSVTNPEQYPIIDERCVESLRDLGQISWQIINQKNWLEYLKIIRNLAAENGRTAREIEKGLFAHNRIKLDKEYRNLYK